jgi:hypothetical protein
MVPSESDADADRFTVSGVKPDIGDAVNDEMVGGVLTVVFRLVRYCSATQPVVRFV